MASVIALDNLSTPTNTVEVSVPEAVQVKHEEPEDTGLGDYGTDVPDLLDEGLQTSPAGGVDNKQASCRRRWKGSPINAESLSTHDQIIMTMKQEHRTDREIAEYLEQNGHVAYKPKTISTRYVRLRKRMAERLDEQLDKGEAVWDAKNDSSLLECVTGARRDIAKIQEDAEAKLWHMVSEKLHNMDHSLNFSSLTFSSRGCRERYESIMSGKLPIYPELKDLNLDHDITRTQDSVLQARYAKMEAARRADTYAREAVERYQSTVQSPPISPRQAIPSYYIRDHYNMQESGSAEGSLDVEDVPSPTNRATNLQPQVRSIKEELALIQLPSPVVMNREEIEAEMSVRGYKAHGNLETLRTNLLLARKGDTSFPPADTPCDIAEFKKMLKEKEIWEYDSDETIEDEEVVGTHDGNTTTSTPKIPTQKTRNSKRLLKRAITDSTSDSSGRLQERPVKKLRIRMADLNRETSLDAGKKTDR